MKSAPPRRASEPIQPEQLAGRIFESIEARTGWMRSQTLIALSATLVIVLVCCVSGSLALATQPPEATSAPSPTFVPLPTTTANDVLAEFRKLDATITNVKPLKVPNTSWAAVQGVQFDVVRDKQVAQMLLLSYDSDDKAGADAFKARYTEQYGKWSMSQVSNVLLVVSPASDPHIANEFVQCLSSLLLVPYRNYLQTPVPTK